MMRPARLFNNPRSAETGRAGPRIPASRCRNQSPARLCFAQQRPTLILAGSHMEGSQWPISLHMKNAAAWDGSSSRLSSFSSCCFFCSGAAARQQALTQARPVPRPPRQTRARQQQPTRLPRPTRQLRPLPTNPSHHSRRMKGGRLRTSAFCLSGRYSRNGAMPC